VWCHTPVNVNDLALALTWLAVFAGGIGVCLFLSSVGFSRMYVRDVLHLGAGLWPLGWPAWQSIGPPILVASLGLLLLLCVPALGRRSGWAARFEQAVSDDDEQWAGLVLYAVAAAALTVAGVLLEPFPAAAALLALALGDGLGGILGRRWGRHRFHLLWAKRKSVEGTTAVAAFSALGIAVAAWRFDVVLGPGPLLAGALAAAAAEALAPLATDNLTVPAAVWLLLMVTSG
jgi:phytol kinase